MSTKKLSCFFIFYFLFFTLYASSAFSQQNKNFQSLISNFQFLKYVDPLIGTGGKGFAVGNTFPGATVPFAMVKVSPDTTDDGKDMAFYHCGGYYYYDPQIKGFSHTHLSGTGAVDYGNLLFIPTTEKIHNNLKIFDYRSNYSHQNEIATPGYYSVLLDKNNIKAEFTATEHTAYHKYTFPKNSAAKILIDVSASIDPHKSKAVNIKIIPEKNEVMGMVYYIGGMTGRSGGFKLYFTAKFNNPFVNYGIWLDGKNYPNEKIKEGIEGGAYLEFSTNNNNLVQAKVAISYISVEQAELNLKTEIPHWDFNKIKILAEEKWNKALNKIVVSGGSEEDKKKFYTAIYHTMMMPTIFTDVNGLYVGFDKQVHKAENFTYYTDMSMWDTFRTVHPLFVLIEPQKQNDFIVSMIKMCEQGKYIPKWPAATGDTGCMTGTPADIVIADSYIKGINNFNVEEAYNCLKNTATKDAALREGLKYYIKLGYLPADKIGEATSKSLEYYYNDWALANLAKYLGKKDDYEMFKKRAANFKLLWDNTTKFLRPKNENGEWVENFNPLKFAKDYTEGTAWHYLFYVPFDVPGLISLFGGKENFITALNIFFENSDLVKRRKGMHKLLPDAYYWHSNEPDIDTAYFYNYAQAPFKTQEWVRKIMTKKYTTTADGIPGNDDAGTMSAWYIFSAMGFYPIAGGDTYLIGSPIFEKVIVHLSKGDLIITAKNSGGENIYVQKVQLNGKPLTKPWFKHSDIANGGKLEFVMGNKPAENFKF